MSFVKDLKAEDNSTPASATSAIVAKRLGKTLRERYQDNIHKRECEIGSHQYDDKMASRAIAAFVIYNLAAVDDSTAGKSVCDSSYDGCIDALWVNHIEKKVVVVQSKFNKSGNKTWERNDFLSFKNACDNLQKGEYHRFDEILQNLSNDIDIGLESIDYKFLFVMAHTGKRGAADTILLDMQQWQDELNSAAMVSDNTAQDELPFQIHLVSAEDLTRWLEVGTSVDTDLKNVEIEFYGRIEAPHPALYGQISGIQILDWWELHETRLFDKNIRNMLGSTEVNDSIRNTAINHPEMFWYYNNGITLLVSAISPHRQNQAKGNTRGTFDFSEASIINGAQTVSTIGQLFSNTFEESINNLALIKVPVRFIQLNSIENEEIAEVATSITKANNHQNRVLGRDFASQHSEQIRLAKELAIENYHYQLLRTSNQNNPNDENSIDLDEALDSLACLTMTPSTIVTLKDKRGRFFEDLESPLYKRIFNPSVSGIKVINAVLHFRVIERMIDDKLQQIDKKIDRKRHGIITHSNKVLASVLLKKVCGIERATELVEPNEDNLLEKLNLLADATEKHIQQEYPNSYPARFFINVTKVDEILTKLCNTLNSGN